MKMKYLRPALVCYLTILLTVVILGSLSTCGRCDQHWKCYGAACGGGCK